MAKKVNFHLI